MPAGLTVFVLSVVVCALAHFGIVRSVIRARSAAVDPAVPRPKLFVEIVWALIPAVALAVMLFASWPRVRANALRTTPAIGRVAR